MESIADMWKDFSISEEEEVVGVEDGGGSVSHCLLGQLITHKPFNHVTFHKTMSNLWKIERGLSIREVDTDIFLFFFGHDAKRDQVLHAKFWVQIYGIPLSGMCEEEVGFLLGNKIGTTLEVEKDIDGNCWGKFLHVRISIDITKPIRRVPRSN
ncbi:hypothetical protein PanWU01x14_298480 [Parasponia andersonii]|uniref:Uncharacterized protein n=1 Tax=Parasponia andersonii TaxID=3476 RepID=A0A2P5AUR5_PARAD|nr:hypothetical protein PanWU01x14_298480 [Parasponia andersonii]